jgi:hypothetical protein
MNKLVRRVHATAISAMCAVLAVGVSTASAAPGGNGYAAAMATAKQKAAAKDYPAAVAAYQAALAAQPDDATALSELSWASFLAGDYATAEHTGVLAAASAKQPALQAMAWFNAGHAEEAQGKLRSARESYQRSLALRDNADVKRWLAGATAALLAPHALLGPFATPEAFCAAQKLTAEQCQPKPRYDDSGHDSGFEVAAIAGQSTGGSFKGVAMIEAEGPMPEADFPVMNLAIQVGTQWYVLPDVGTAASGHGGGYTVEPHMVGARLVIDWHESVGRFGHSDEASTIVCGVASGAPSCAGPLAIARSSTDDPCGKAPDCTRRPVTDVSLHCRATLRGDLLTIDRDPGKLENPDGGHLVGPRPGACDALPWGGKHRLAF